MRVSEGSIISDFLSSPDVRNGSEDSLKSQGSGVGFSHLCDKDEHEERTSVEVSDGDFSQEKIASEVGKSDFVDAPVSVDGVVVFATVILLDEIFPVVIEDVLN